MLRQYLSHLKNSPIRWVVISVYSLRLKMRVYYLRQFGGLGSLSSTNSWNTSTNLIAYGKMLLILTITSLLFGLVISVSVESQIIQLINPDLLSRDIIGIIWQVQATIVGLAFIVIVFAVEYATKDPDIPVRAKKSAFIQYLLPHLIALLVATLLIGLILISVPTNVGTVFTFSIMASSIVIIVLMFRQSAEIIATYSNGAFVHDDTITDVDRNLISQSNEQLSRDILADELMHGVRMVSGYSPPRMHYNSIKVEGVNYESYLSDIHVKDFCQVFEQALSEGKFAPNIHHNRELTKDSVKIKLKLNNNIWENTSIRYNPNHFFRPQKFHKVVKENLGDSLKTSPKPIWHKHPAIFYDNMNFIRMKAYRSINENDRDGLRNTLVSFRNVTYSIAKIAKKRSKQYDVDLNVPSGRDTLSSIGRACVDSQKNGHLFDYFQTIKELINRSLEEEYDFLIARTLRPISSTYFHLLEKQEEIPEYAITNSKREIFKTLEEISTSVSYRSNNRISDTQPDEVPLAIEHLLKTVNDVQSYCIRFEKEEDVQAIIEIYSVIITELSSTYPRNELAILRTYGQMLELFSEYKKFGSESDVIELLLEKGEHMGITDKVVFEIHLATSVGPLRNIDINPKILSLLLVKLIDEDSNANDVELAHASSGLLFDTESNKRLEESLIEICVSGTAELYCDADFNHVIKQADKAAQIETEVLKKSQQKHKQDLVEQQIQSSNEADLNKKYSKRFVNNSTLRKVLYDLGMLHQRRLVKFSDRCTKSEHMVRVEKDIFQDPSIMYDFRFGRYLSQHTENKVIEQLRTAARCISIERKEIDQFYKRHLSRSNVGAIIIGNRDVLRILRNSENSWSNPTTQPRGLFQNTLVGYVEDCPVYLVTGNYDILVLSDSEEGMMIEYPPEQGLFHVNIYESGNRNIVRIYCSYYYSLVNESDWASEFVVK